jgi:hypothetical protein
MTPTARITIDEKIAGNDEKLLVDGDEGLRVMVKGC